MNSLRDIVYCFVVQNLNKLKDVEVVHLSVNGTFEHDYERALPAMSFRVTVRGGDKKEIAEVIFNTKPCGIISIGNTKVKVEDDWYYKHKIYFERVGE